MQNNQFPPHLAQQYHQQVQQGRVLQTQIAYPLMANIQPSERTHGTFSTYGSRLKQSHDNALLLPESYIQKKTRFQGSDSDEEFEEMIEESDEEEEEEEEVEGQKVKEEVTSAEVLPIIDPIPKTSTNLVKTVHRKIHNFYSTEELETISHLEEVLVPIRLDIDIDSIKLRDRFLWNINEQYLTPEKFAEMLCEDLSLSPHRFIHPIADSIRTQVIDFESIQQVPLNANNIRVNINLDLQIGKVNYRDQFEWELLNDSTNAPEVFSRQLAAELGVGGEYISMISHAIREQLFRHRRQFVEEMMVEGGVKTTLDNPIRSGDEVTAWTPHLDMLSNDELEKLLISQERNIRRMRRETRFKRTSRRMTGYGTQ
ncbi:hypothetical protein BDB01DRAFT_847525 [Pilobolus umbonatus]|nr:hypothetical protein BDB01DRAFT_847525 [Pilobolus umbonatus]